MSLLQRTMIGLARSGGVSRAMRAIAARTALATRFVGGADSDEAVRTAHRLLARHGIRASLFYLGEYVVDPAAIENNVAQALAAVQTLARAGLDAHVSVDPTAIGFMTSDALGTANARRIAAAVAATHTSGAGPYDRMMLDMEDRAMRERTCRLHAALVDEGLPAALTLQARRRRTIADLTTLTRTPATIRLVKGAFPESPEHDYVGRTQIDEAFLQAARLMLSPRAREAGFRPVFATHDHGLTRHLIALAQTAGWAPQHFEFEMLYGARPDWQLELRERGYTVRVYLPFGADWWPYAARRIGEHPRNAWLLARSLRESGYDIG